MRTSRLARDTERVMRALRSPADHHVPARRSLRSLSQALREPRSEHNGGSVNGFKASTTDDDGNNAVEVKLERKRKRYGQDESALNSQATSSEQTDISQRRTPRKALKLDHDDAGESKPSSRKAKRQPAKRIKGPNGEVRVEAPPGWERVYNVTAGMRKRWLAPVDTMGCESLAEVDRSPRDQRLQTLLSLMLSSQTKDTVTAVAMKNLQQNLAGGLCLESLLKVDPTELNELISKVGFHNNKTKFIKQTAEILRDKFAGDIPDTIDGLVSLPGVGPKMAYLCMSAAWGRDEGIGVDVHVHRITNLWGWHKTSTPEQTRAELEAWLPRDKWHDINNLLVGFGQTYCPPVGRKCQDCDLYTFKLCPSASPRSTVEKKVKREIEIKLEDDTVIKDSQTVIEQDDVGIKVEISSPERGAVLLQGRTSPGRADEGTLQ